MLKNLWIRKKLSISQSRDDPGEKLYRCEICLQSFGLKHSLDSHERLHTGEKT